jgi:MoaA/NifB/PqqE/SkfB family radical SAM enzyme
VEAACPSRCPYCEQPEQVEGALTSAELHTLLGELARLGCLRVSFSGGEPMLRADIGGLVDACAALGMAPEMNSCGAGFAERVVEVRGLRLLKLSMDGPPDVHDRMCGRPGSYDEVIRALGAARAHGIPTVLVCTITRDNVGHLEHVLELARQHGVMAAFQPFKPYRPDDPLTPALLPDPQDMRAAVAWLEAAHDRGLGAHLRNARAELRRLRRWPDYPKQRCWAGRVFCIVGVDGTVFPCDRTPLEGALPRWRDGGLAAALEHLPEVDCDGCGFCGAQELNLALNLDPRVARTLLRLVRR